MQGTHQINKFADKIYVRFSNIRTSCVLASQAGLNGRDWSVKYVAPRHFTQVCLF